MHCHRGSRQISSVSQPQRSHPDVCALYRHLGAGLTWQVKRQWWRKPQAKVRPLCARVCFSASVGLSQSPLLFSWTTQSKADDCFFSLLLVWEPEERHRPLFFWAEHNVNIYETKKSLLETGKVPIRGKYTTQFIKSWKNKISSSAEVYNATQASPNPGIAQLRSVDLLTVFKWCGYLGTHAIFHIQSKGTRSQGWNTLHCAYCCISHDFKTLQNNAQKLSSHILHWRQEVMRFHSRQINDGCYVLHAYLVKQRSALAGSIATVALQILLFRLSPGFPIRISPWTRWLESWDMHRQCAGMGKMRGGSTSSADSLVLFHWPVPQPGDEIKR